MILGWKNKMPGEELNAKRIGYIGRMDDPQLEYPFIRGEWENGILAFYMVCLSNGKELKDKLEVEVYTLKQDLFSRNSGLIETDWMDDKCVVLAGLGSAEICVD